ncbi:T9SS type A sorting domain-containing protein, partial [bacterium]|nr:T9SS type A sorting domain-containing protein [bacterium]
HVQGNVDYLSFSDFCPGTVGSVGGNAAGSGWTATNYPNSIVFTTTTPLTSGTIDTFWLSHPTCNGEPVIWQSGDSSGTIGGPLPVEMTTFQAFAGDEQVTLRWQTASEQDNDYFVLYKRRAGQGDFQRLAEIPGHGTTSEPHDYDYVDSWVQNSVTYEYQISDVDISGRETFYEYIISATPGRNAVPTDYALYQNHPNPFNPTTEIVYDVKEAGQVTLKVFNLLGQEIATLVDAVQSAQRYHVSFDGSTLASGVYLYTIQVNDFYATRKMVLLK